MKLYNLYNVISNKTVRDHEKHYRKFRRKNDNVLGRLVQTSRGYFINGHQVDLAAVHLWHELNNNEQRAAGAKAMWNQIIESNED